MKVKKMKVYTEIKIDLKTGETISEKSFEYSGDIASCLGGGSVNSYDKEYNRAMAAIAERTAAMSEKAFESWDTGGGRALEEAQFAEAQGLLPLQAEAERTSIQSNIDLNPLRSGLEKAQIGSASELLPLQTQAQKTGLDYGIKQAGFKSDLMNKFYSSIGKNSENSAVMGARTDVAGAISEAKSTAIRDAQRRGVSQPTGKFGLEGAKLQVGAMAGAREQARTKNLMEYERGLTI